MLGKPTSLIGIVLIILLPAMADTPAQDNNPGQGTAAGTGREMVRNLCVGCHNLDIVVSQRYSEQEWRDSINRMVEFGGRFTAEEINVIADYLTANYGIAAQTSEPSQPETTLSSLHVSPNRELFMNKCFECHGASMFKPLRQDRLEWEKTLYRMIGRGALWTEEEIGRMADYLAREYGEE